MSRNPLTLMRHFLVAITLLVGAAVAQQGAYYGQAFGVNPFSPGAGATPSPIFLPFAQARVCSFPASGTPCTPLAPIWDLNSTALTVPGGQFGQVTTNVVGQFNFLCNAGLFEIQIEATSSNTPQEQYIDSCPSGFAPTTAVLLIPNQTPVTVNGNTTSNQNLHSFTSGVGAWNVPGKTFHVKGSAGIQFVNTTETVGLGFSFGSSVYAAQFVPLHTCCAVVTYDGWCQIVSPGSPGQAQCQASFMYDDGVSQLVRTVASTTAVNTASALTIQEVINFTTASVTNSATSTSFPVWQDN